MLPDSKAMLPDSTHVQLKVSSISNIATSIASVGQLVRWPRVSLAIIKPPADPNTARESEDNSSN